MDEAALYYTACSVCGSTDAGELTVQSSCKIVRCRACGFVYVNPRPKNSAFKDLYVDYLPDRMEDPYSWKAYMGEVFRKTADIIEVMSPGRGRSLDIGCGFGFFVEEMKKRGWDASGIDISPTPVAFARKSGLEVRTGAIEEAGFKEASFDAVTMFYVLEHVPDPLETLLKVRSILKPGGVLALRVPHTTPIVRALGLLGIKNNLYDPPFHLSDFSPKTMRMILEKAGFSAIKTFIGGGTRPESAGPRLVSLASTAVAETLFRLSSGRFLLPGVSKTTIAIKR